MVVQGLEVQGWSEEKEERIIQMFTLEYGMNYENLTVYKEDKRYDKVINSPVEFHITKTRLFKYIDKFTTEKGKFSDKKILIFFIFLHKT